DNRVKPIAPFKSSARSGSPLRMYIDIRLGGDEDTSTAAINREITSEDPELVQAAEAILVTVEADSFVSSRYGLAVEESKRMFMEEQAAMYLIATWDLPNFTTNEDIPQEFRDKVGYFQFPTVDGEGNMNNYVGGPGVGLFVSENSDVKEEAKEFSSFFAE